MEFDRRTIVKLEIEEGYEFNIHNPTIFQVHFNNDIVLIKLELIKTMYHPERNDNCFYFYMYTSDVFKKSVLFKPFEVHDGIIKVGVARIMSRC